MAAFLAACEGTTTEIIKEVPVEVVKEVQVSGETVIKEVEVEVIKTVEVTGETKEVEVEKVIEVEVPVEKIVEVEVMPVNPKAESLVIGLPVTQKVD